MVVLCVSDLSYNGRHVREKSPKVNFIPVLVDQTINMDMWTLMRLELSRTRKLPSIFLFKY